MKKEDPILSIFKELSAAELPPSTAIFLKSLHKWFKKTGNLSTKQYTCLLSIYNSTFQSNELKYKLL
jgi:hypothetical protein